MRRKSWVKINDYACGTYNTNSQIKFKTSILKSIFCDYSDAYILASGTLEITGAGADHATKRLHKRNKGVIFKNFAPLTHCISEINNTQIDNAKYLDVVMSVYNLIEYSDNFSKTAGSLWFNIALPLKYLTNFWRTLEMSLINCEINLILTCSENCVISSANGKQNLQ